MNQPLGYTVGNLLEVKEAVDFLKYKETDERLYELVIAICSEMYILSGIPVIKCEKTGEDISLYAERKVRESILSGKAYNGFLDFVSGQGGYLSFIESELSKKYEDIIPNTVFYADYKAEKDGYILNDSNVSLEEVSIVSGKCKKKIKCISDWNFDFDKKIFTY